MDEFKEEAVPGIKLATVLLWCGVPNPRQALLELEKLSAYRGSCESRSSRKDTYIYELTFRPDKDIFRVTDDSLRQVDLQIRLQADGSFLVDEANDCDLRGLRQMVWEDYTSVTHESVVKGSSEIEITFVKGTPVPHVAKWRHDVES